MSEPSDFDCHPPLCEWSGRFGGESHPPETACADQLTGKKDGHLCHLLSHQPARVRAENWHFSCSLLLTVSPCSSSIKLTWEKVSWRQLTCAQYTQTGRLGTPLARSSFRPPSPLSLFVLAGVLAFPHPPDPERGRQRETADKTARANKKTGQQGKGKRCAPRAARVSRRLFPTWFQYPKPQRKGKSVS